jgi:hypothetical protein
MSLAHSFKSVCGCFSAAIYKNLFKVSIKGCSARRNHTQKRSVHAVREYFLCSSNAAMRPAGRRKYQKRRSSFRYALQRKFEQVLSKLWRTGSLATTLKYCAKWPLLWPTDIGLSFVEMIQINTSDARLR